MRASASGCRPGAGAEENGIARKEYNGKGRVSLNRSRTPRSHARFGWRGCDEAHFGCVPPGPAERRVSAGFIGLRPWIGAVRRAGSGFCSSAGGGAFHPRRGCYSLPVTGIRRPAEECRLHGTLDRLEIHIDGLE